MTADTAATSVRFPDLGHAGRTRWWVWPLGVLALVAALAVLLALLVVVFGLYAHSQGVTLEEMAAGESFAHLQRARPVAAVVVNLATVATFVPAVFVVVRWVHGRPWRTVVTAAPRFRWRLFAAAFVVTLAVMALSVGLDLALGMSDIRWTFARERFLAFLPACLLLIPLQVLGEEVLFRGYLLQLVGRFTGLAAVRLLAPATLFFAIHLGNPEVDAWGLWAVPQYAVLALYLTAVTLRTDGLEASTGLHLGINLGLALVIGAPGSVLATAPLMTAMAYNPVYDLTSLAVLCGAHYGVMVRLASAPPRRS